MQNTIIMGHPITDTGGEQKQDYHLEWPNVKRTPL